MLAQLKQQAKRHPALLRATRSAYPALNWARGRKQYYLRAAPYLAGMRFDDVRFSNRGNEPEAHLRRTSQLVPLRAADVLVLGAGRGEELRLWEQQAPRTLTAVDYFAHPGDWSAHALAATRFAAMDVRTLAFADDSFDLVASTALLEHVAGIEDLVREMARVTRPGGLVFANFGPLFYTHGGAHFLGSYEHLWMTDAQFDAYLVARGIAFEQEEALHWLRNGMFSRRTYDEYLALFDGHFDTEHVTLAVSPEALRFRREQPEQWRALCERYAERDLLTFAMTVWMRPKAKTRPIVIAVRTDGNATSAQDARPIGAA